MIAHHDGDDHSGCVDAATFAAILRLLAAAAGKLAAYEELYGPLPPPRPELQLIEGGKP